LVISEDKIPLVWLYFFINSMQ